jgi:hypothetical protein
MGDMTQGKPVILIAGAWSGTGERMSDIEAAGGQGLGKIFETMVGQTFTLGGI